MDTQKNSVDIQIEGDPIVYKLTFDYNEIARAETLTGCNLATAGLKLMAGIAGTFVLSAVELRALLYAAMKPSFSDVTLEDAGGLLSREFAIVHGKLFELYVREKAKIEAMMPVEVEADVQEMRAFAVHLTNAAGEDLTRFMVGVESAEAARAAIEAQFPGCTVRSTTGASTALVLGG
jgi:hypothetical protein